MELYGSIASPFVRKVNLFMLEKGLDYKPRLGIGPQSKDEQFQQISPLGKIPALKDGDFGVSDSSVICQYLERKHPEPAMYPADPELFARALWLEEYCDTALMTVTGGLVFQHFLGPKIFGKPTDDAKVQQYQSALPQKLSYLDRHLLKTDWMVGDTLSIADVTVASHLSNLEMADVTIDDDAYPHLAAYAERWRSRDSWKVVAGYIEKMYERMQADAK